MKSKNYNQILSAVIALILVGLYYSVSTDKNPSFIGNTFGLAAIFFMMAVGLLITTPLSLLGVDCWNGSSNMLCRGAGIATTVIAFVIVFFLIYFALEGTARKHRLKKGLPPIS